MKRFATTHTAEVSLNWSKIRTIVEGEGRTEDRLLIAKAVARVAARMTERAADPVAFERDFEVLKTLVSRVKP